MLPCLPSDDPALDARASSLQADRERYRFDRSIGGLPLAAEVPKGDHYSVGYLIRAARVELMLLGARAVASFDPRLADERQAWDDALAAASDGFLDTLVAKLDDVKKRGPFAAPLEFPSSVDDYDALFGGLPAPTSRAHADSDAFFAWQRVAGCNPTALRRLAAPDARFEVTEAHFRAAIDDPDDTLSRAMSEGRLYLLDRTALHGVPTTTSFGFERFMYGPLALFVRTRSGPLMPIAIQVAPTASPEHPIATPADGAYWRSARLLVQAADAADQGLSQHLGMCHAFANAVLLCTARELASTHPLRVLLWPHFEMTLAANETMKTAVIGKDGFVDQLQGPALYAGIELAREACCASVRDHAFERDLQLRGVADVEALPDYPYRDDARAVHAVLERWVRDYLALYYTSDAAVREDAELARWYAALRSPDAGGLSDVPELDGREALVGLVTTVVFRITGYHAVINYGGYDFFAWPATLPTARWGPAPTPSEGADAILKVLPPLGLAEHTLDLMLPQRELRLNHLGGYPARWFADPRVAPLLVALHAGLEAAESEIARRDAARPWSFPYLRPSRIAQSIHV